MLTELGLRNFKAFGDEMQRAPLAPITLIYGPNSGGKSSIIQALLLLKQSFEANRARRQLTPLQLVTNGSLANLGTYASMIHRHDAVRDIEVDVAYEVKALELRRTRLSVWSRLAGRNDSDFWLHGNVGMLFTSDSSIEKVHYGVESSLGFGYKMELARSSNYDFDGLDGEVGKYQKEAYAAYLRNIATYDERESYAAYPRNVTIFNNEEANSSLHLLADALEDSEDKSVSIWADRLGLPNNIKHDIRDSEGSITSSSTHSIGEPYMLVDHIRRLRYLGPIMADPKRYYDSSEHFEYEYSAVRSVGSRGENVPLILLNNARLKGSVNEWMEKFDVPYTIDAESVSNNEVIGNELVSMYLTHKYWGADKRHEIRKANHLETTVTLADVGFGINQMLPLILQGVISSNDIICVEQPEIHLHPRLQAHISDLLVDTSGIATSNSKEPNENGNQWIVETHSEMLVRRLQRRIREGKISNNDVSVLYVDPQDDGSSTIQRLDLDEDGRFIDEWPHGFFDEGYRDIMGY